MKKILVIFLFITMSTSVLATEIIIKNVSNNIEVKAQATLTLDELEPVIIGYSGTTQNIVISNKQNYLDIRETLDNLYGISQVTTASGKIVLYLTISEELKELFDKGINPFPTNNVIN